MTTPWFQSRSTDWAADINQALADANTGGGQTVILPPDRVSGGIFLDSPIIIPSNVGLVGYGPRNAVTISPGAIGANVALIKTSTYDAQAGIGEGNFEIGNLSIDGDSTNAGLGIWGFRFYVHDLSITNCTGGRAIDTGWITQSTGAAPHNQMEATWRGIRVSHSGNVTTEPVRIRGPHDSQWIDIIVASHIDPPGTGVKRPSAILIQTDTGAPDYSGSGQLFHMLHVWGRDHNEAVIIDDAVDGTSFTNCVIEGADTNQLRVQGNGLRMSATSLFGIPGVAPAGTPNAIGIKFTGAINNSGHLVSCQITNTPIAALDFIQPAGNSIMDVVEFGTGGITGVAAVSNVIRVV